MNWNRWDVAQLGRAIGGLIVLGGIGLAAWDFWALPQAVPTDDAARSFIEVVLSYAFSGFIVMLVAELASRMNWTGEELADDPGDSPDRASDQAELPRLPPSGTGWATWNQLNLVQLGRAAGTLIAIGGTVVSAWAAFDNPQGLAGSGAHAEARLFLASTLRYAFYGFLVIVLAELVNRIGWRGDETAAEPDDTRDTALPAS